MKFSLNKLVIATLLAVPAVTMASIGGTGMLGGRHDFASSAVSVQAYNADGTLAFTSVTDPTTGVVTQVPKMETITSKFIGSNTKAVGLCSFCHTPHSATSTALLWNRAVNTTVYTWSDATAGTTGGTALKIGASYVGPTAKCLACHDGTAAVGDVVNYSGATGSYSTYHVGDRATANPTDPKMDGAPKVTKKVGAGGDMKGAHPVGVPYPYKNAINDYNNTSTGTDVVRTDYVGIPAVSAQGVAGVKLYNQTAAGAITAGAVEAKTGIECSSCHDVHNKQTVDDFMLRGKMAGATKASGYLCVQCHNKAD